MATTDGSEEGPTTGKALVGRKRGAESDRTVGSSIAVLQLRTEDQWARLGLQLDPGRESRAMKGLVTRLREQGVRCAIVEYGYLDRDYSSEFAVYYAKLFHRYERETQRYHFFLDDMSRALRPGKPSEVAKRLRRSSDTGRYVGFIVRRPVADSPVARAVLNLVNGSDAPELQLHVRAAYEAHLLGVTLRVEALPFTEQDRRIGSCAHAALWICARHFQARHGAPWLSIPAIADAASTPMDVVAAQSLPAGAQGLHPDNLTRAFKAMGRHPFVFTHVLGKDRTTTWPPGIVPASVLARYVESGIPVVLGLKPRKGRDGHSVVACGMSRDLNPYPPIKASPARRLDISCLISDFLVHDDQRGPALPMPVKTPPSQSNSNTGASSQGEYSLDHDVFFMLVPLPDKIFVPAESAELKAWDAIDKYMEAWGRLKSEYGKRFDDQVLAAGDLAFNAWQCGLIVARTYLTLGWKYKRWMLNSSESNSIRSKIMLRSLPKMLWVTEFGLFDDLNRKLPAERRIVSHCAIDATTSGRLHPPLIFHAPGLLTVWDQIEGRSSDPQPTLFPVPDDRPYIPRYRRNEKPPKK